MKNLPSSLLALACATLFPLSAVAANPLIMDQFTADPTARVFEGRIYVYPSHDILATEGHGRPGWFCMEDYHVFSSENLTGWTDHGVIVSQTGVPWTKPDAYAMWAPDCVFKNGKYYFYFPAIPKEGRGFRIGVAIADHPGGPFRPEAEPIADVRGIDPCVFIDKDGSAYLFYGARQLFVVKLRDDMLQVDGTPAMIDHLPTEGLLEGPFVFERNGIYYLTYPHVANKTERLEYATSSSPLGPYTPAGVIMDESPSGCWTNHQSIVEYHGEWLLFYHDKDLSPDFDKARSIRADYLHFNDDGTIQKVIPTLRGVGVASAKDRIQLDRYSAISGDGVTVSALDPANLHEGWKVSLTAAKTWVRFNAVDFGPGAVTSVNARAISSTGDAVEIHVDAESGPLLGRIAVEPGSDWKVVRAKAGNIPTGVHDLFVAQQGDGQVDLDWISFE